MLDHEKARGIRGLIERNCREAGPVVVRAGFKSAGARGHSSAEELLQHQRGDSANDGAEDGADKHVTAISGGLGFRFKPVAFIAGFIIGAALTFLLVSGK